MPDTLQELAAEAKENRETLNQLTKSLNGLVTQLSQTPAAGVPTGQQVFGAPWIRHGEDPLTSRGFSFMKMLGVMSEAIPPEDAKIECDVSNRLYTKMTDSGFTTGGLPNRRGNKFLCPLGTGFFPPDLIEPQFRREMKSLVCAGVDGADWDEMNNIKRKQLTSQGYGQKALSWLNELSGGALVAPPEMGELIELLRNKEALVNAGARVVPLPPQGRLKYPRQTAPSNTYWVGENSPITESIIGTGEVTLQAKKLAVLIKAPNELIRFASPAAEALLRDDMTKSLALGVDLAGLEGNGGDTRPRGIINTQNINKVNSSGQAANGDRVMGVDIYRMIAAVEESNAEFEAFIMRPKTLYKYYQLRADAVAQGDAQGPFLFNLIREAGMGVEATLAGFPAVKSTQISQVRSKGTASNLTYVVGGMWSDLLIGMFGAIEFAATTFGDTSFVNDQTWVRGILSCDVAARHEAAFVYVDFLDTTIA
ncbi:MAG: phage major capsid protein [Patescibacteria group bacterium]|nr:phage major capsid protein [Patescibacteria group bacterium]